MSQLPVGRLLCVGIRGAEPGEPVLEADLDACARAGVGGVILFDVDVPTLRRLEDDDAPRHEAIAGAVRNVIDPDQLRRLIAHIRALLGDDVFVSIDQEGGQVARLSPRRGFMPDPTATAFAALNEVDRAIAARAQAERLADLGFDLNFAPCVDLALDPDNGLITGSERSFGSDPAVVVACAEAVLDAHAAYGVAACLKHFPGHGSSRGDTHLGAVDVTDTWQREAELAPYHALIHRPGMAVMAAHVLHRGLDPDRPASLSSAVIDDLLRGELGFTGVVVTDAIDMAAIADHYSPGEAAVAAVLAGADLVVDAFNLTGGRDHPADELADALGSAVRDGRLPRARIEASLDRLDRLRRGT